MPPMRNATKPHSRAHRRENVAPKRAEGSTFRPPVARCRCQICPMAATGAKPSISGGPNYGNLPKQPNGTTPPAARSPFW